MKTPIKSVMTKKLLSVPMGTSLFEAHELMKEKRIRHLPIVDELDDVVGFLSQRDLAAIPDSKNIKVEMMMSSPVEFVEQSTPLREAIFKMLEKKISALLISDVDENVVGIVTTDDLLWCLAHLLADEKDEKPIIFSADDKQTIGTIAQQLSQMGI